MNETSIELPDDVVDVLSDRAACLELGLHDYLRRLLTGIARTPAEDDWRNLQDPEIELSPSEQIVAAIRERRGPMG